MRTDTDEHSEARCGSYAWL